VNYDLTTKHRWDDWVAEDRIRKLTDENRQLAKQIRDEQLAALRQANSQAAQKKKSKSGIDHSSARCSEERSSQMGGPPRTGQKRGRDLDMEKEERYLQRPAVRIKIGDNLKSILVDDWENVTKNLQLIKLPATYSAAKILDDYAEHRRASDAAVDQDVLDEVVQGVLEYFHQALGRILLYRFEREQYREVHSKINNVKDEFNDRKLYDIYGGEHLLRLFGKMTNRT